MSEVPNGNNLQFRISLIEKEIERLNREKARAEDLVSGCHWLPRLTHGTLTACRVTWTST